MNNLAQKLKLLPPGTPKSSTKKVIKNRRSTSLIPRRRPDLNPPTPALKDHLKNIRIVPRPTKSKLLRPSLSKFLKGKSSLYSVAAALTRVHDGLKAKNDRIQQCHIWGREDIKDYRQTRNAHYRNDPPDLPRSLGTKLFCCRSSVSLLIEKGFIPFYYTDFPTVFFFFKMQEKNTTTLTLTDEKFNYLVAKASLNSATVAVFVGANNTSTLPKRKGLGTLYFSNGNVISGDAALAMRVKNSTL